MKLLTLPKIRPNHQLLPRPSLLCLIDLDSPVATVLFCIPLSIAVTYLAQLSWFQLFPFFYAILMEV